MIGRVMDEGKNYTKEKEDMFPCCFNQELRLWDWLVIDVAPFSPVSLWNFLSVAYPAFSN